MTFGNCSIRELQLNGASQGTINQGTKVGKQNIDIQIII